MKSVNVEKPINVRNRQINQFKIVQIVLVAALNDTFQTLLQICLQFTQNPMLQTLDPDKSV